MLPISQKQVFPCAVKMRVWNFQCNKSINLATQRNVTNHPLTKFSQGLSSEHINIPRRNYSNYILKERNMTQMYMSFVGRVVTTYYHIE